MLLNDYLSIIIFILLSCFIACFTVALSLFLRRSVIDPEKLSAYECGFNPFDDARQTFNISFYLIAMLFIIFDVEVALLIPLILVLQDLTLTGFYFVNLFFLILSISLIYEWKREALEWV